MAKGYNKSTKPTLAKPTVIEDKPETVEYVIKDIIPTLDLEVLSDPIFANHAQLFIDDSDLIIDFYSLLPHPDLKPKPIMRPVARIVYPMTGAKGLASAVANLVVSYQNQNKLELPDKRGPDVKDTVKIEWK